MVADVVGPICETGDFLARVRAPSVTMRVLPAAAARVRMSSATAGVSMTGRVSGGQHRVVMPPLAAARDSEAIVALCSCPGSRVRAQMSIRPGQTMQSRASISSVPSKPSGAAQSVEVA